MKDTEIYTANSTATSTQIFLNILNSKHCTACFSTKSDKWHYSKKQKVFICDWCYSMGLRFNE